MTEEQSNNSNNLNLPILVCSTIVIFGTKQEEWYDMDYQSYYNLLLFSLVSTASLLVMGCLSASSLVCKDGTCFKIFILCYYFAVLCILVGVYICLGTVWHHDKKHSIPFYWDFWTEWSFTMKHSAHNHPLYYMGDVLVRIYSTCLIALSCCMLCLLVCGGVALGSMKEDEFQLPTSSELSSRL